MPDPLPCLILTGASGIVSRHFLQAAQDRFCICTLARRSLQKARVPQHPNIRWLQVDIGNRAALRTVMGHIKERCKPEFVIQMAAHYDSEGIELPDDQDTHVNGTRPVLEQIVEKLNALCRTLKNRQNEKVSNGGRAAAEL